MNLKKFDLEYNPCSWWLRSLHLKNTAGVGTVYDYDNFIHGNFIRNNNVLFLMCIVV